MKAVKIIIVAAVLAALGYGIWRIVTGIVPEGPTLDGVSIPKECQGIANRVKKKCDRTYGSLSDGDFNGLQECYNKVYNYFAKDRSTEGCMTSVELTLNTLHREHFVAMSKKEQSNEEWPNLEKMDSLCDTHINIAGNSDSALLRIKQGCTEYASLEAYNKKVKEQCGKNKWPSNTESKWDMNHVEKLIKEECPQANPPANHTIPYEEAQQAKQKLFDAHVEYLKAFVRKAETNVKQNPGKEQWNSWSGAVRGELNVFETRARHVYDKSPSDKVKEVKNALFNAHVEYLKAYAASDKNVLQNPNKQKWEKWLKEVRGELKSFVEKAKQNYGEDIAKNADGKAKEVKTVLFDTHVAYLNARIAQDSLTIKAYPNHYISLNDELYGEIEYFSDSSYRFYGKSDSDIVKDMKYRVDHLGEVIEKAGQPSIDPQP